MTRKIKTYEDLLQEEQRLNARLSSYKDLIKGDIAGIKDGLNPIKKAKETVRNLFIRDDKNSPAINFGLNFVLDFIIRTIIPNRTSVFTKTIIPFITKNYVSHLITDEQRGAIHKSFNDLVAKVDSFIKKTMQKKQEASYAKAAAAGPHYEA